MCYGLLLLLITLCPLSAQAQGGTGCNKSSFDGTYFYLLTGDVAVNGSVQPYAELGKLTADGQGSVSGQSKASIGGSLGSYSLAGSYSIQGNCTGTLTLSVNSQWSETLTFQIVEGGGVLS